MLRDEISTASVFFNLARKRLGGGLYPTFPYLQCHESRKQASDFERVHLPRFFSTSQSLSMDYDCLLKVAIYLISSLLRNLQQHEINSVRRKGSAHQKTQTL